ncbi:MAG: phosphoglucosamine mutase [Anaerolineaceae bacterium]|jgi:phosphoglucosamine mutase
MTKLKYFGTDGIRGVAGQHPISADFVRKLGWAAGSSLCQGSGSNQTVVIGRDTRLSGLELQTALTEGLLATGVDVLDLGVIPTPGIAFLTQKLGASAGAVISASHNPASENGIKFLNQSGMKLSKEQEVAIEGFIESPDPESYAPLGSARPAQDQVKLYVQDLIASQPGLDLKGCTLLVDCANGASYQIAPQVLREFGANVIDLNTSPDGLNINDHAGSEFVRGEPQLFAEKIRQYGADAGIAFDGDADRVILFDETGIMVDGDGMLAILADYLHLKGLLSGDALVTTTMANGALHQFAESRGFSMTETPVGDKYVIDALALLEDQPGNEGKIGVGGEQSGHIILLDKTHRTGDGIRTALMILNILRAEEGQKLSDLNGKIQKYPQLIASCTVGSKPDLKTLPELQEALDQLKTDLPGLVRYNARYSGTEPKFRLMLETDTRHSVAEVAAVAWRISDLIQSLTQTPKGAKIEVLNVSEGGLMPRGAN